MTHEADVRDFFAKRLKRKVRTADWTEMGVKTEEQERQQGRIHPLVDPDGDYAVTDKGGRNQMVRSHPLGPDNVPMFQSYETTRHKANVLVSELDRRRIWTENNPQPPSDLDRLQTLLKLGPVPVNKLHSMTGWSRNRLLKAGALLSVKKGRVGGSSGYWVWRLPTP